ncbi:hypothetical protein GJW-30_1_04445 [Variibacter gotjawalensis]|jgi:uncharacterized membrane protein YcaP (DUF421 family)|uniref:YetF C-terminal domain-containing protein n=1 Tax=Variibacter gotjawalensis TaxID=1333996 RepID=A0A0S3Q141_9BRAD|nr:YetF domain-containing protein [Variibacter gotjawalensis]NIK47729.1 uncharacterized membrane protein YcaP (DUF421 family) [Variibacter gotjawalensis]RZS49619.1 uncharacterized protein DUF421 [Variibacter gotjawalensis]BAT61883.1 hypothetical protein GJW-30_1_04445 [Variibacter gotjawalensis]
MWTINWTEIFIPSASIAEIMIRGTIMYLFLFLALRFVSSRQVGQLGISDVLVIVVIADASQNAFAGEYRSITEGVMLVLVIIFWNYIINFLSHRVPGLRFLASAPAVPLISRGVLDRRNMRANLITLEELESHLRQHGVEKIADVKRAMLEGDGSISVVKAA